MHSEWINFLGLVLGETCHPQRMNQFLRPGIGWNMSCTANESIHETWYWSKRVMHSKWINSWDLVLAEMCHAQQMNQFMRPPTQAKTCTSQVEWINSWDFALAETCPAQRMTWYNICHLGMPFSERCVSVIVSFFLLSWHSPSNSPKPHFQAFYESYPHPPSTRFIQCQRTDNRRGDQS